MINQPASKVFNAFIEPELLLGWWNVERCLVEKRQGGLYSLAWGISDKGFHYILTGIITLFNPSEELLIEKFVYFNPEIQILGPTWLSIKLEETGNATILQLVQGGFLYGKDWEWYYNSLRDAIPKLLKVLKKNIENKS